MSNESNSSKSIWHSSGEHSWSGGAKIRWYVILCSPWLGFLVFGLIAMVLSFCSFQVMSCSRAFNQWTKGIFGTWSIKLFSVDAPLCFWPLLTGYFEKTSSAVSDCLQWMLSCVSEHSLAVFFEAQINLQSELSWNSSTTVQLSSIFKADRSPK